MDARGTASLLKRSRDVETLAAAEVAEAAAGRIVNPARNPRRSLRGRPLTRLGRTEEALAA